jgi:hypothetical protein
MGRRGFGRYESGVVFSDVSVTSNDMNDARLYVAWPFDLAEAWI